MPQTPLNIPIGAKTSAPITTNATTLLNLGSRAVFAGASVNTAGSAWTAEVYNGNPASGGVLVGSFTADAVGLVPAPLVGCPNGLYIVTAGTTPGSMTVFFY